MTTPWEKLLHRPHGGHFVQLYKPDREALTRNVCQYMWEGLRQGDGVLAITSAESRRMLSRALESAGADLPALLASRQLVLWDAETAMADFMFAGQPDWQAFERIGSAAMRQVRAQEGVEELRAYGEMVGILWQARQFAAAIRLEQFWNKLLSQASFSLYCAYPIDVFAAESELANLEGVLCAHTHVLPGEMDGRLEAALYRAMDEILGSKADGVRGSIRANFRPSWAVMPAAQRIVLWLRKNLPEQAGRIVQLARDYTGLPGEPSQASLPLQS